MVITTAGTTIAIQDPRTQAKTYFRGRAEILFNVQHVNHDRGVPIPDIHAVGALWNDIFRQCHLPLHPACDEAHTDPLTLYTVYESQGGTAEWVSTPLSMSETRNDSPSNRFQTPKQNLSDGAGSGSQEDPIDVDTWIATIEAAMNTSPSFNVSRAPVMTACGRSESLRDGGAIRNGQDPKDRMVRNNNYPIRVIRKRNLHDEQGVDARYDADGEASDTISISSTESEMSDTEFMEMMEILRTPESHQPIPGTFEACDEGMAEEPETLSSSSEEELEAGEIRTNGRREDDRMVMLTQRVPSSNFQQCQNLTDSLRIEFQNSVDAAVAQAIANAQQQPLPPTPPATPSPPSSAGMLLPLEQNPSSETWGNSTTPDHLKPKSAWDDPVYVTVGQLDELGRQINNLERQLKRYFPDDSPRDSPQLPLHNTPYVFWTSHADLEHRVYVSNQEIFAHQQKLEAHLMAYESHVLAFEGYQQELGEQLDRRFKGLRDSTHLKIRAVEEWVSRMEERVAQGEVKEIVASDRFSEGQKQVNALQEGLNNVAKEMEESRGVVDLHLASVRTQISVLNQIVGIPSALSPPSSSPATRTLRRVSPLARDPRVTRRRKGVVESVPAASNQEISNQAVTP